MKKIKNTNFYIPTGDTWLTTKPAYKKEEFEMAKPFFKHNSVALDVGCHVGFWTVRLCEEFDKVIAVDPCEDFLRCLEVNTDSYDHKLEIHGLGLGSSDELCLEIDRVKTNSTLTATADYTCDEQSTEYTMDTFVSTMLDTEIEGPASLDFIKISVQGYEIEVLKGAVETIKKWKPTVFVECQDMEDEDIAEFMKDLGYKIADDDLTSYVWVFDE